MDEETKQDILGMKKTMESLRAQMKLQNKDYEVMARALLKAFRHTDGELKLADERAALEAFLIAERYYGN